MQAFVLHDPGLTSMESSNTLTTQLLMDSKRALALVVVFNDCFYCLQQFFLFLGSWAWIVSTMQPGRIAAAREI
jgi:hypothetical protein